jgi:phage gpG-like protein
VADKTSVKVRGLDELARGSARLADEIEDEATKDFGDVADKAASVVSARVPRRTGALAASVVGLEQRGQALVGMGGSGVPYAGWIEFGGTRGRPYVPSGRYLYPAAFSAEPMLISAGENAAKDEIRGFRWPRPT